MEKKDKSLKVRSSPAILKRRNNQDTQGKKCSSDVKKYEFKNTGALLVKETEKNVKDRKISLRNDSSNQLNNSTDNLNITPSVINKNFFNDNTKNAQSTSADTNKQSELKKEVLISSSTKRSLLKSEKKLPFTKTPTKSNNVLSVLTTDSETEKLNTGINIRSKKILSKGLQSRSKLIKNAAEIRNVRKQKLLNSKLTDEKSQVETNHKEDEIHKIPGSKGALNDRQKSEVIVEPHSIAERIVTIKSDSESDEEGKKKLLQMSSNAVLEDSNSECEIVMSDNVKSPIEIIEVDKAVTNEMLDFNREQCSSFVKMLNVEGETSLGVTHSAEIISESAPTFKNQFTAKDVATEKYEVCTETNETLLTNSTCSESFIPINIIENHSPTILPFANSSINNNKPILFVNNGAVSSENVTSFLQKNLSTIMSAVQTQQQQSAVHQDKPTSNLVFLITQPVTSQQTQKFASEQAKIQSNSSIRFKPVAMRSSESQRIPTNTNGNSINQPLYINTTLAEDSSQECSLISESSSTSVAVGQYSQETLLFPSLESNTSESSEVNSPMQASDGKCSFKTKAPKMNKYNTKRSLLKTSKKNNAPEERTLKIVQQNKPTTGTITQPAYITQSPQAFFTLQEMIKSRDNEIKILKKEIVKLQDLNAALQTKLNIINEIPERQQRQEKLLQKIVDFLPCLADSTEFETESCIPPPVGTVINDEVHLGQGVWLAKHEYNRVMNVATSPSLLVRYLSVAVYGDEVLRSSSVSGKLVSRPPLSPTRLSAIRDTFNYWLTEQRYSEEDKQKELSYLTQYISSKIQDLIRVHQKSEYKKRRSEKRALNTDCLAGESSQGIPENLQTSIIGPRRMTLVQGAASKRQESNENIVKPQRFLIYSASQEPANKRIKSGKQSNEVFDLEDSQSDSDEMVVDIRQSCDRNSMENRTIINSNTKYSFTSVKSIVPHNDKPSDSNSQNKK